jgi:hypothetical protein
MNMTETRSLNSVILGLAFVGAVLIGLIAQSLVPETATGRAIAFVAFMAAFFPVARYLWFREVAVWRYWLGLAGGALLGWSLDVWRSTISPETNHAIGLTVFALATACLVWASWKTARRRG